MKPTRQQEDLGRAAIRERAAQLRPIDLLQVAIVADVHAYPPGVSEVPRTHAVRRLARVLSARAASDLSGMVAHDPPTGSVLAIIPPNVAEWLSAKGPEQ